MERLRRTGIRVVKICVTTFAFVCVVAGAWAALRARIWESFGWWVTPSAFPGTAVIDDEDLRALQRAAATNREAHDPMPPGRELSRSELEGRSGRLAEGLVLLVQAEDEIVLRFQDFRVERGPDLRVEVSKSPADALTRELRDESVEVGLLEHNVGDVNLPFTPGGNSLGEGELQTSGFRSVLVVDHRTGLVFAVAPLHLGA